MTCRRICIIRTGALGDVVLTLPVIHNLRRAFPQTPIDLVGNPRLLALAQGDDIYLDDIDRAAWAPLFAPGGAPAQALAARLQQTDLVLSYLPDPDGAFSDNLRRLGVPSVITHPPRPAGEPPVHAVDHLMQPLRARNIPTPVTRPVVRTTRIDHATRAALSGEAPHLIIHPGSGGAPKRWPPECFAAVADAVAQSVPCRIEIARGPADGDLADRVAARASAEVRVLPEWPLQRLAEHMACCSAYLGNDSGPSHLAAAVGIPTVALFGPTDPRIWAPRGPFVRVVQAPDSQIASIRPEAVTAELLAILSP